MYEQTYGFVAARRDSDARIFAEIGDEPTGLDVVSRTHVDPRNSEPIGHNPANDRKGVVNDQRRGKRGHLVADLAGVPPGEADEPTRHRHRLVVGQLDRSPHEEIDERTARPLYVALELTAREDVHGDADAASLEMTDCNRRKCDTSGMQKTATGRDTRTL